MDKDRLKHHLKNMAQAEIAIEQGLHRFDLLELEILSIKAIFREHSNRIRIAVCSIIGMLEGEKWANYDFNSYADSSPTPFLNNSQEGEKNE